MATTGGHTQVVVSLALRRSEQSRDVGATVGHLGLTIPLEFGWLGPADRNHDGERRSTISLIESICRCLGIDVQDFASVHRARNTSSLATVLRLKTQMGWQAVVLLDALAVKAAWWLVRYHASLALSMAEILVFGPLVVCESGCRRVCRTWARPLDAGEVAAIYATIPKELASGAAKEERGTSDETMAHGGVLLSTHMARDPYPSGCISHGLWVPTEAEATPIHPRRRMKCQRRKNFRAKHSSATREKRRRRKENSRSQANVAGALLGNASRPPAAEERGEQRELWSVLEAGARNEYGSVLEAGSRNGYGAGGHLTEQEPRGDIVGPPTVSTPSAIPCVNRCNVASVSAAKKAIATSKAGWSGAVISEREVPSIDSASEHGNEANEPLVLVFTSNSEVEPPKLKNRTWLPNMISHVGRGRRLRARLPMWLLVVVGASGADAGRAGSQGHEEQRLDTGEQGQLGYVLFFLIFEFMNII
ncbi:hypothetical protein DFH27DRAFT_526535 [Peziza echinospora]|nr:hypothetical protein DFH27DRAFT_526535 [Peziza echinospora]